MRQSVTSSLIQHLESLPGHGYNGFPRGLDLKTAQQLVNYPSIRDIMRREINDGLNRLGQYGLDENTGYWSVPTTIRNDTVLHQEIILTLELVRFYQRFLPNLEIYDNQSKPDFFGHTVQVGDLVVYPRSSGSSALFGVAYITKFHPNGSIQVRHAEKVDGKYMPKAGALKNLPQADIIKVVA